MSNYQRGKPVVPAHFFEKGDYEVWAKRTGGFALIAKGLSLRTAKAFQWPGKEIRLEGKVIQ